MARPRTTPVQLSRKLEAARARASSVGRLGAPHSFRRWSADRKLNARASNRQAAFTEAMWADAAAAVGADMVELAPGLFEFRRNGAVTRTIGQRTPFANPVATALASAKHVAYRVLAAESVPIPEHVLITRDDSAQAFDLLERDSRTVVAKPARGGGGGQGVTTSIASAKQLTQAIRRAALTSSEIVVEREVTGEHYRILLLDGEVLDVLERRRPSVVGDGTSTIEQLMFAEYARRLADERSWKPFPVDLDCVFALELQGLTLSTVPDAGNVVVVKGSTNISGFRECTTYLGDVAEDVIDVARRAASAVGVRLAGVDVVTRDIGKPLEETGGVILEVNPLPGLFHHYHVANEEHASRVARPILHGLLTADV